MGNLEAVAITAGSGTNVGVDQVNQGGTNYEVQVVKIGLGEDGVVADYLRQGARTSGSSISVTPATDATFSTEPAISTVTLYALYLWSANTEYSYALPATCRKLAFHPRSYTSTVRFAFGAGRVAASNDPFQTLLPGMSYDSGEIKLSSGTVYAAVSSGSTVLEIEAWS